MQKGLVSYTIKNKTKYFQPTSPEKIKDYIESEKRKLEKIDEDIEKLIPDLVVMQKESEAKQTLCSL